LLGRATVVESDIFFSFTKPKYFIDYITIVPFYKPIQKTFKVTKFDYLVTTVAFIVFIYAFFFASFHPIKDTDGNIIYQIGADGREQPILDIDVQVFIVPIIIIYEMLQLTILPGKTRLKNLPWRFWTALFIFSIYKKIKDGREEYRQWRKKL